MWKQVKISLDCQSVSLAIGYGYPLKITVLAARMRGGSQPRLPAVGFANACASCDRMEPITTLIEVTEPRLRSSNRSSSIRY